MGAPVSVPEALEDDLSSDPEGGLAWLDDAMTMVCILFAAAGDSIQCTAAHVILIDLGPRFPRVHAL